MGEKLSVRGERAPDPVECMQSARAPDPVECMPRRPGALRDGCRCAPWSHGVPDRVGGFVGGGCFTDHGAFINGQVSSGRVQAVSPGLGSKYDVRIRAKANGHWVPGRPQGASPSDPHPTRFCCAPRRFCCACVAHGATHAQQNEGRGARGQEIISARASRCRIAASPPASGSASPKWIRRSRIRTMIAAWRYAA